MGVSGLLILSIVLLLVGLPLALAAPSFWMTFIPIFGAILFGSGLRSTLRDRDQGDDGIGEPDYSND